MKLHLLLGPGDDVAPEVAAAGRQAVDVAGRQHVRPHVELRHLAHERLRGVEAAPEGVLRENGAASDWRPELKPAAVLGQSYLFLPQNEDPSRFEGVPGGKVVPSAPLHAILVRLPLSIACGPGHADMVPLPVAQRQGERHSLVGGVTEVKGQLCSPQ